MKNPLLLEIDLSVGACADFWSQLWQALPSDTEIYDAWTSYAMESRMLSFRLVSEKFDWINEGQTVPRLVPHFKHQAGVKTVSLASISVCGIEPHWVKKPEPKTTPSPQQDMMDAVRYFTAINKATSGPCICDLAYTGLKTHRKDCPCHP